MTYKELMDNAAEYENKCDWPFAIAAYKQIYDQTPTLAVISKLAWCYSRNNDFEAAKAECAKLIEKDPQNPRWLYLYGYQFYIEKNWAEAVTYFEKALKYNPEYFIVLYRIAYAYLQLAGDFLKLTKSEYWKAIGYLKKAHQIWESSSSEKKNTQKSTYYDINFLHGKALMSIPNHNSEAIRLFKQALALKDDPNCQYNLAKALYYDKQYVQAKQVLPDSQKYYVVELSAYIEHKLGNIEESLAIALKLLQKRPKDYLLCFVAYIKLETGNYLEAYQYVQKAVAYDAKNHKNYYVLAQTYFKLGLLKKALEAIVKAESLKKKKYNSSYRECVELREQIISVVPPGYVEDTQLIASLENINSASFYTGTIVQYNNKKGFGFVYINHQRIFVHTSKSNHGELYDGAKIRFEVKETKKGKQAININVIK
ncbi:MULTISPECIES: tetratricopeptide repeat protein [Aminobacterium]|uniref:tetratricopeptide repeat protein n=1 Tax=Aminobacterium TaxID=81466 RepID=UPI00257BD9C1|nr:tetratricopeptide repeat protein [Aminobacterium sp. UBA4834]